MKIRNDVTTYDASTTKQNLFNILTLANSKQLKTVVKLVNKQQESITTLS